VKIFILYFCERCAKFALNPIRIPRDNGGWRGIYCSEKCLYDHEFPFEHPLESLLLVIYFSKNFIKDVESFRKLELNKQEYDGISP